MDRKEEGFWIPIAGAREIKKDQCGIWIPPMRGSSLGDARARPEAKSKKKAIWVSCEDFVSMAQQAHVSLPKGSMGIWIPMARLAEVAENMPAGSSGEQGIHVGVIPTEAKALGAEIDIPKPKGIWIPMARLASVSVFKK